MALPPDETFHEYVYRRVPAPLYKIKRNEVASKAFLIEEGKKGLSVYRADKVTPYTVLEARINDVKANLSAPNEETCKTAESWLAKNPDVVTLLQKEYRVVIISIAAIVAMGFTIEEPDEKGHLNILGSAAEFEAHQLDFVRLIQTGEA